MGIKGTVRRSLDSNFIHTNIDIDLIITEEPGYGKPDKPEEIFHIIEHFCLGKRRLYLFGRDSTIRPGWLTVGPELTESYFDKAAFNQCFDAETTNNYTGSSERIDMLRPKTPPLKAKLNQMASSTLVSNQNPNLNPNMSMISNMQENNNNGLLNGNFMQENQSFNYSSNTVPEATNQFVFQ